MNIVEQKSVSWTLDDLRGLYDQAMSEGDVDKAALVLCLLRTHDLYDRQRDALAVIRAEIRRTLGTTAPEYVKLNDLVAQALREKTAEPTLDSFKDNTFTFGNSDWAVRLIVESLRKTLGPAPNFIELELNRAGDGTYLVTVQRPRGKSPTKVISDLKAEIAQLSARCDEGIDRAAAEKIVDNLISDLSDRSGFGWDGIDDETRGEIRAAWVGIVSRGA